jgi:hypothetical protein
LPSSEQIAVNSASSDVNVTAMVVEGKATVVVQSSSEHTAVNSDASDDSAFVVVVVVVDRTKEDLLPTETVIDGSSVTVSTVVLCESVSVASSMGTLGKVSSAAVAGREKLNGNVATRRQSL